jgi:hypothetical protein
VGRGSPAQASARRRRASDCTQRWIDALERSAVVANSSAAEAPWRASRQRRGMPVGRTLAPSRPGHLLQPGPVTGVAPADLGPGSTAHVPGREFGSGVHPGRRGLPGGPRPGRRRGRGRRGETRERRPCRRVSAKPRRACAAGAEDRCRGGGRGDRDGRASVTCAGAHDPKPQCRVGRLSECPACAGRGDTSSADDPIRKRHQDL